MDDKTLRSGELARLAGISPDTLRFYERKGLLPKPPRSTNNYRRYPQSALDRVHLIRSALALGFTTQELAFILKERDAGGTPCAKVRRLAQQKLENLRSQIRKLHRDEQMLKRILQEWDQRLKLDTHRPAKLLESLPQRTKQNGARR